MHRLFSKQAKPSVADQERRLLLQEEEQAWAQHFVVLEEVEDSLSSMMQRWEVAENKINAAFKDKHSDLATASPSKFSILEQHHLALHDFLDQCTAELEEESPDIKKRIVKITECAEKIRAAMVGWVEHRNAELRTIILSYDMLFPEDKQQHEKRMTEVTLLFSQPAMRR